MDEKANVPSHTVEDPEAAESLSREWLVTNGLGGYASGTVSGALTRRYHGVLIGAYPNPLARLMMLNALGETLSLEGDVRYGSGPIQLTGSTLENTLAPADFCLEAGLPTWTFEVQGFKLKKSLHLPYRENTVYIQYRLEEGSGQMHLTLRPGINIRSHDDMVDTSLTLDYRTQMSGPGRVVVTGGEKLPAVHMECLPCSDFTIDGERIPEMLYPIEESRGYQFQGTMWSPGYFRCHLSPGSAVTFVASSEEGVATASYQESYNSEIERRKKLIEAAEAGAKEGMACELVLAADQFTIDPVSRSVDEELLNLTGQDCRTVIAGYHWFTDWGRDTMISFEGLTLVTGRYAEAKAILKAFSHYVKDGLIPNMFPEGKGEGLYHTADATLWFFHAADRYFERTNDRETIQALLPVAIDIADRHIAGTRFGIHVDQADGLLVQGAEGLQLTWMDAKVGDLVVTPRRGKAVEINALWYNALQILGGWLELDGQKDEAQKYRDWAAKARESFNQRFWSEGHHRLLDVVDGQSDEDSACRPNQIFSISLRHPVLDEGRWQSVVQAVESELLTPVGLRTLAPNAPNYKARYFGDIFARDAAYHEGTVWPWLIGPFIDAWIKTYPDRRREARKFLEGFAVHLNESCIGSISEICDADAPHIGRGCISQAWSVAEVLRTWAITG